jgi:hypothetical protein
MAIDALSSVPLGRSDTGEAVVLGKGNFEDFTGNILKIRAKEGEERKQTNAEIGKLLQDQVQSKWAKDNIDIFQPRMQAIKDKTLELYKEKKGRLNSVDLYGIQSEWNKLKAEADASNSLYAEEQNRIKALEEDPTGLKYDAVESQKLRDLYRDPMSNPELAKEVKEQFGGSIIKWRANNERRFANVGAYNIAEDIDKYAKDKLSKRYTRLDAKGERIFETDKSGLFQSTPYLEGLDKEKARTSYNAFYDRTDYKGKKFKEEVGKMVGRNFDINEKDGTITPNNREPATLEAYKSALEKINPSMSVGQKAEILRKEYGLELIKSQYPQKQGFEDRTIPQRNNVNVNVGGGPSTKYNWAAGSADVKNLPELTWGKTLPGKKAIEGVRNYVQKLWADKVPYVTVSPTKGTETPTFRLTNIKTGKPMEVATLGFKKSKNGDWVYVSAEKQSLSDGSQSMEEKKLEADKKFEPIETNLSENTALATELAAAYDFGTTEELIDFLNKKAKQSGIKEKGVTRPTGAIPSIGGTPSNKSTEKDKPKGKVANKHGI